MGFSKTGIASLLLGIALLLAMWYFVFANVNVVAGIASMVLAAVEGGLVLLGIALILLGLFLLFI